MYNGTSWSQDTDKTQRFVYDGWNVVLMLNHDNETLRKYALDTTRPAKREGSRRDPGVPPPAASQGYTWGLDLSGSQGPAGFSPRGPSTGEGLPASIHGAGGGQGWLPPHGGPA